MSGYEEDKERDAGSDIRVLILSDRIDYAEKIVSSLNNSHIMALVRIADSREAFLEALNDFSPTIIISDFKIGTFDGISALDLMKSRSQILPFLFFTRDTKHIKSFADSGDVMIKCLDELDLVKLPLYVHSMVEYAESVRDKVFVYVM